MYQERCTQLCLSRDLPVQSGGLPHFFVNPRGRDPSVVTPRAGTFNPLRRGIQTKTARVLCNSKGCQWVNQARSFYQAKPNDILRPNEITSIHFAIIIAKFFHEILDLLLFIVFPRQTLTARHRLKCRRRNWSLGRWGLSIWFRWRFNVVPLFKLSNPSNKMIAVIVLSVISITDKHLRGRIHTSTSIPSLFSQKRVTISLQPDTIFSTTINSLRSQESGSW